MADTETIDRMIERLGTDLKPVRRLRPPGLRAAMWLGVVAVIAAILASFADVAGMVHRLMGAPDMWLAVTGSTLTAVLGAVAAFELSVPGRSPWWAALPVPSLVLWIGASGMGCMRTWRNPFSHYASADDTKVCLTFIIALSIPLSALMVIMIRQACPLRPNLTAAAAGIAIAAGAASLLNFFHPYDASVTDLTVHLIGVAIVVGLNQLFARRLLIFRRRPPSV